MTRLRSWPLIALLALLARRAWSPGCGDDDGGGGRRRAISRRSPRASSGRLGHPLPAVRVRPPAGLRGLRRRHRERDRKAARARRRVRQDALRHDLPQPRAGEVRHGRVGGDDHARARRTVDFSDPYFPADQSLMVKKGSDIKTVDDLDGQDDRRAARHDRRRLRQGQDRRQDGAHLRPDRRRVQRAPGRAGRSGHQRLPVSKYAEQAQPDLAVVQTIATSEEYGIAFPGGLRPCARPSTRSSRRSRTTATFSEIYKKWFKGPAGERARDHDESASGCSDRPYGQLTRPRGAPTGAPRVV